MDLTKYTDELQHQLTIAASAGGEEALALAERLSAPLDASVRLVLLEALSEAASEITAELAPGSVDVRLQGRNPEFIVTTAPTTVQDAPPDAYPPHAPATEDGATSRTTLRLPDHLKTQVESAAAAEGISVNAWLVRAVGSALARPTAPQYGDAGTSTTGRVTGWVH